MKIKKEIWRRRNRHQKTQQSESKNTEEITYAFDEMFNIFETLEGKKQVISDREKLKFMYDLMSKNFRNYLDIDEDTKPQELNNKINKKINMIAYLEGGEDYIYYCQDDPMEIDIIEKSRKNSKYNKELKERLYKIILKTVKKRDIVVFSKFLVILPENVNII